MKRRHSSIFVAIYWVLLVVLVLMALTVGVALATTGVARVKGPPVWTVIGLVFSLPVLIGWRIWVHFRARRSAALLENFGTEAEDV